MSTNAGGDAASRRQRPQTAGWKSTWTTAAWLGIAMVVALPVGVTIGFLSHNSAPRMVAVFAIAVIAFLGILLLAHRVASYRPFDSGEMRMAIAGSFTIVYFVVLAIFLFSISIPTSFAQDYVRNLTTLMGVIVAFYFASSAAVQYAKIRAGASTDVPDAVSNGSLDEAAATPPASEPASADPPAGSPIDDLLDELKHLRVSFADLQAAHDRLAALVRDREGQDASEPSAPAPAMP